MNFLRKISTLVLFISVMTIGLSPLSCINEEVNDPALQAPTKCSATDGVSEADLSVKITWDEVKGANFYIVFRSTSPTGEFKKVSIDLGGTFHFDNSVDPNITYYYKVKAYDHNGNVSKYSNCDAGFTWDLLNEAKDLVYSIVSEILEEYPINSIEDINFSQLYLAIKVLEGIDFKEGCVQGTIAADGITIAGSLILAGCEYDGMIINGILDAVLYEDNKHRLYVDIDTRQTFTVSGGDLDGLTVDVEELTLKIDLKGNIEYIQGTIRINGEIIDLDDIVSFVMNLLQ